MNEIRGICLDLDTVCVRPWNQWLDNKFVSGKVHFDGITYGLCFAVYRTEVRTTWKKLSAHVCNPLTWND